MKPSSVCTAIWIALLTSTIVFRVSGSEPKAMHAFRLEFQGQAGVRLRLLLITKSAETATPERREEIVTIPSQIDFTTMRCYAWIDTLPDGQSGNEGDACRANLLKDGKVYSAVEMNIKKQNHQSGGFGDL